MQRKPTSTLSKKCYSLAMVAILSTTSLMASTNANAALLWFSRANCLPLLNFNESVTWDPFGTHYLHTYSGHYIYQASGVYTNYEHLLVDGWRWTRRSRTGHTSDSGSTTWYVWGNNRVYDINTNVVTLYFTEATDCNL